MVSSSYQFYILSVSLHQSLTKIQMQIANFHIYLLVICCNLKREGDSCWSKSNFPVLNFLFWALWTSPKQFRPIRIHWWFPICFLVTNWYNETKMLNFLITRWSLVITQQKDSILTKKWVNVPATKDVMIPKTQATKTGIILSIARTKVSIFGKSARLFINSMNYN